MRFPRVPALCAALLAVSSLHASEQTKTIQRVLLISVDGLHAIDLERYVQQNPNSAMAELASHGLRYTSASASKPSDSFPGILAITTGGTPNSTGVWYDDSYDRKLSAPGSDCSVRGTEVVYDESIDFDPSQLNGGGGINPAALPLDPDHGCTPVYPHQFLRVNTIFEVVRQHGGLTAWSDKHPAYDLLQGPSGSGIADPYNPEIASVPTTVPATIAYDDLKAQAVLNWIDGLDHTGTNNQGVPVLFGSNFQEVSVGQKAVGGGYTDAVGTPSTLLQSALDHMDQSLGKIIAELKKQGLYSSTLIVLTAKHGQSPIDPNQLQTLNTGVVDPGSLISGDVAQETADDIALLWLKDQSTTNTDAATIAANRAAVQASKIYWDGTLQLRFNDPTKDSRVPDIIVQPNLGVIYTHSKKKIAEHGGFSEDDTNVALLVSHPAIRTSVIKEPVETTQIAPTILQELRLSPWFLQAVRQEKTPVLPGLPF